MPQVQLMGFVLPGSILCFLTPQPANSKIITAVFLTTKAGGVLIDGGGVLLKNLTNNRGGGVKRGKGNVCLQARWPSGRRLTPVSLGMKWLGILLLPIGWDASLSQGVPPSIMIAGTHLEKRDNVE